MNGSYSSDLIHLRQVNRSVIHLRSLWTAKQCKKRRPQFHREYHKTRIKMFTIRTPYK